MKSLSIILVGGAVLLVVLRMNGFTTDISMLDAMVHILMESIHLA